MAKMNPKMIALCAAAIGTIYTAGYVVTETPEMALGQHPSSVAADQALPNRPDTSLQRSYPLPDHVSGSQSFSNSQGNLGQTPGSGSQSPSKAPDQSQSQTQGQYKDGVYYGVGSNRIGSVQVAVTIKQGKIAKVNITRCTTHYPQRYIDPVLPNQVLERQSAQVDIVSGATKSSQDFRNAVQEALDQAQV